MPTVVLYAFDTMADWEFAYVTTSLAQAAQMGTSELALRVLGDGPDVVTTMGGLRVLTDGTLAEVVPDDVAMLVLPGGETWAEGHDAALKLARDLHRRGVPVAGICGGTLGLARAGVLDERRHTSNVPEFLAESGYAGGGHYEEARTVDDDGVITAPGTMPLDFAAAIMRRLALFPDPIVDAFYGLYLTGERKYYEALNGGGE